MGRRRGGRVTMDQGAWIAVGLLLLLTLWLIKLEITR
jgi:hypothetical protein